MAIINSKPRSAYWLFIGFLVLFVLNLCIPAGLFGIGSYTSRMWLIFQILVSVLAIIVLIREKLPNKTALLTALSLGILAGLVRPMSGLTTALTYAATWSIFHKHGNAIPLVRQSGTNNVCISLAIGAGVGILLGTINLFLGNAQNLSLNPSLMAFVYALNPGIFEEVSFRLFMYAFSVYLLKGQLDTKAKRVSATFNMVLPHVLIHIPDMFFPNGAFTFDLGIFINIAILTLLFGIPFAILQRKRDLLSSMMAHGLVDFIRFCFMGLPL